MSEIAAFAAMLALVAPAASAAQHRSAPSQARSNGAGTAQADPGPGVTTGSATLGSGKAATGPSPSTNDAVKAENELLDRKLKSICRGC
jgi:hypothetical protein